MVGNQRVVLQRVPRHHQLRGRLLAPGQRRGISVLRLLQLIRGDEILRELRLVAIELLFRESQSMLGGIERGLCGGGLLAGISRIETGDQLSLADSIAETHIALDQFAGNSERHGIRVARGRLDRVANVDADAALGRLDRQRHDYRGRRGGRRLPMAGRERQCGQGRQWQRMPRTGRGAQAVRKRLSGQCHVGSLKRTRRARALDRHAVKVTCI